MHPHAVVDDAPDRRHASHMPQRMGPARAKSEDSTEQHKLQKLDLLREVSNLFVTLGPPERIKHFIPDHVS